MHLAWNAAALYWQQMPMADSTDGKFYLWLALGVGIIALFVAAAFSRSVISQDSGTPAMQAISNAIREGAEAFLGRQYRAIGILAVVIAVLLFFREARQPRRAARWSVGSSRDRRRSPRLRRGSSRRRRSSRAR